MTLARFGRGDATRRLHDDRVVAEPTRFELLLQRGDVGVRRLAEVGVEHRRRPRSYSLITGATSCDTVTNTSGNSSAMIRWTGLFVGRVEEAPQEAHGDRLDPGVDECRHRRPCLGLVEGDDLGAVRSMRSVIPTISGRGTIGTAFSRRARLVSSVSARPATFWIVRPMIKASSWPLVVTRPTREPVRVQQRVRRDGRAVAERLGGGENLGEGRAGLLGGPGHRGDDTGSEVGRRRRCLGRRDVALGVEHDAVGERAAAVDRDDGGHAGQAPAGANRAASTGIAVARRSARISSRRSLVDSSSRRRSVESTTTP